MSSGHAGGARDFRIGDKGDLHVPRHLLDAIGLEPKMRARLRIEGKTLVIERAPGGDNPLDGLLTRKLDQDLFGKIAEEQELRKAKQLDEWGTKVEEAAKDDTPPPSPFGLD